MDDYVVRAVLAAAGTAMIAGPLGCFVVWRRMAYFGDTLSHAALAGVAFGILFGIDLTVGVVAVGLGVGLALVALQSSTRVPTDTLLGILSHSSLAVGMIAVGFLDRVRVDLMGFLFGDLLAVGPADFAWIYAGGAAVLGVLILIWRPLIALTVSSDVAEAEGVPGLRIRLTFVALMAITVALAMKVIGVLLITALLLIPPAIARSFARGPESMALLAIISGLASAGLGLTFSFSFDIAAGPAIVATAAVLFCVSLAARRA
jgi:zinc transport system permease protein